MWIVNLEFNVDRWNWKLDKALIEDDWIGYGILSTSEDSNWRAKRVEWYRNCWNLRCSVLTDPWQRLWKRWN
jgi:hypothetical protein